MFYLRISQLSRSVQHANWSQNLLKLNKNTENQPPSFAFSKIFRTQPFHIVSQTTQNLVISRCCFAVSQRTAKKYTHVIINLSFGGVVIAVSVVVYKATEVNLLNRASARELSNHRNSSSLCRPRLVENAISPVQPLYRKREYFAHLLLGKTLKSTLFSVILRKM